MLYTNPMRYRFLIAVATAASAATLTTRAAGQVRVATTVADVLAVEEAKVSPAASGDSNPSPGNAGDADKAKEAPKESPRLQKLKKLIYDRRPSAILQAWSAPETANADEPVKPDEDAGDKAADKAADEAKALEAELTTLQRHVTLGQWDDVKKYFAELPEDEAKEGYAQMIRSLVAPPPPKGGDQRMAQMQIPGVGKVAESNRFTLSDVLALLDTCPHEREQKTVQAIIPILNIAMQRVVTDQPLLDLLHDQVAAAVGESVLTKKECAWLLSLSGRIHEAAPFLPTFEEGQQNKDAESLVLLARCFLARYEKEKQTETLDTCWAVLQATCSMADAEQEHRDEALKLALSLVPRVREELGLAWLEEMFREDPEFGMKILASTGKTASTALQSSPRSPETRFANLKVQKTIVESLLEKAPERAEAWRTTLQMLADAWLREGEFSRLRDASSSRGPSMQRDRFGNLYYTNSGNSQNRQQGGNQPQPIASGDVLEAAPGEEWLACLDEVIQPKFVATYAGLYLKVGELDDAFPYIERLAADHPKTAKELVHEFIRAWTRKNDPNRSRSYTSSYMYMYGFDVKANGIPLTRSKQQRNIKELTKWVDRIRQLDLEDLDESLLAKAFTTCHSSAEVYRLDDIEKVFGSLSELKAETLAQFIQQMRTNLAGIWRMPANQEEAKTKRKQKDIQAEVIRGYAVAFDVARDGLTRFPDNWQLQLAHACLLLDEAAFHNAITPSSEFTEKRLAALEEFRRAAQTYANLVTTLEEEKQASTVYEHWFYAGLGASDLNQIDHESTADPRQPALIRQAILDLPGEAAESHMGKFANSLFTRMSNLSPAMKFQYLEGGFEIVGDHEQANEARDVYGYYKDLVTEIQLIARLDGPASVGHQDPFGVFIEIHHTKEIERESGGFAKYLQNQQNARYAYNYGRPLTNYRDKFEEGVRAALQENFDVLSVTFADEKNVRSMATEQVGWRTTPYAYLLLKPRGPEIDKLTSLKIDLDFLDTSGYVALPITSAAVPINAAPEQVAPRPYDKVVITQLLDERESATNKLKLEIKASGRGLIPSLNHLVDLRRSDFETTATEDQGVLVSQFDSQGGDLAVISERTWIVDYTGRTDLAAQPSTFHFPEAKGEAAEISYMRYEDADLKSVESTVVLAGEYGEVRRLWPWLIAIGCFLLAAMGMGIYAFVNRRSIEDDVRWTLPETLTPFNVLALLRDIERSNGFDHQTRQDLNKSIESVEHYYFAANGEGNGDQPNLRSIAERWAAQPR